MSNQPPIEVPQGAIRLNTDSHKLEFYAQDRWYEMATDTPVLGRETDVAASARGIFSSGRSKDVISAIIVAGNNKGNPLKKVKPNFPPAFTALNKVENILLNTPALGVFVLFPISFKMDAMLSSALLTFFPKPVTFLVTLTIPFPKLKIPFPT